MRIVVKTRIKSNKNSKTKKHSTGKGLEKPVVVGFLTVILIKIVIKNKIIVKMMMIKRKKVIYRRN